MERCIAKFNSAVNESEYIQRGIVSEKMPSKLFLLEGYSLANLIEEIQNRDTRRLAYSFFNRYPIDDVFTLNEEEENDILNENYFLRIENSAIDALNLCIVSKKGGGAFTLPVHKDLESNELLLSGVNSEYRVVNFYGSDVNYKFLLEHVKSVKSLSLDLYDRLVLLLNNANISRKAEKEYKSSPVIVQQSINSHFEEAIRRGLPTRLSADGDLIKDVSDGKSEYSLCELRIFNPFGIRVYFAEVDGVIEVFSIGYKNSGSQDADIKMANATLRLSRNRNGK
jgi:putative component of toxin-antitoxin plasmid stabilization module